jgi:thioesterase domain-containing protein
MVVRVLLGLRRSGVEDRFRHLRIGCSIAADRWQPQPLSMPFHLYRCDTQPDHLADSPRLGWEDLAPGVQVQALRSRHNRHIRPPSVSQLGALVSEDLKRAETG